MFYANNELKLIVKEKDAYDYVKNQIEINSYQFDKKKIKSFKTKEELVEWYFWDREWTIWVDDFNDEEYMEYSIYDPEEMKYIMDCIDETFKELVDIDLSEGEIL